MASLLLFASCTVFAEEKQIRTLPEIGSQAQKLLTNGESCIAKSDWQCANDNLKQGIALLGENYVDRRIIDDTDQKLMLAQMEESKGNLKVSANLYGRVLTNRLELLHNKTSR